MLIIVQGTVSGYVTFQGHPGAILFINSHQYGFMTATRFGVTFWKYAESKSLILLICHLPEAAADVNTWNPRHHIKLSHLSGGHRVSLQAIYPSTSESSTSIFAFDDNTTVAYCSHKYEVLWRTNHHDQHHRLLPGAFIRDGFVLCTTQAVIIRQTGGRFPPPSLARLPTQTKLVRAVQNAPYLATQNVKGDIIVWNTETGQIMFLLDSDELGMLSITATF